MLHIHHALQAHKFPTANVLAAALEVSPKSIHRDLEFMRDRLNLPLKWDGVRFGYKYTEEVGSFPSVTISEGELLALVVAEKALQQYRGTSFEKPLLSAIKKMEQSLPDTISLNPSNVGQSISFHTRTETILDLAVFDALAKASAARQQLQILYRKAGQKDADRRIIDPYHLGNINGEWFLFAFDHLRKDFRTFAPARIGEIKRTGHSFIRSPKFSLEERLRDSFGVHSGHGHFDVEILFTPAVADYVREKKWHDSQQRKEFKDGSIQLKFKLSSLGEIERWVLSWGGNAAVIKPRELKEAVRKAAQRILNQRSRKPKALR